jgi:hypothetical protein
MYREIDTDELRRKAKSLGVTQFGKSVVKGKRFYVIVPILGINKTINFGSDVGSTYYDHHNLAKKKAWYARHSKIRNKLGQRVINLRSSPSYYSARILWA